MTYSLPTLDYAYDALEPYFDKETMEIHHTKHHQAYIDKLNAALENSDFNAPNCIWELVSNLEKVPESIHTAVRNNGGGHANHSFFWKLLSPNGGDAPSGALAEAINQSFGGFDAFKKEFQEAAITRFGSGWAWLCLKKDEDRLYVSSTANQDNPQMGLSCCKPNLKVILGLDVWEHAYYLKYQNKRPDYIAAFWNVVNWEKVEEYYTKARNCCGGGSCSV